MALIGVCHCTASRSNRHGDDPMKTMKRAHLFGGPKRMRRAKERIERVQLLTASARERAMDLAQKYKEGNSTTHDGGDEYISHRRGLSPPTPATAKSATAFSTLIRSIAPGRPDRAPKGGPPALAAKAWAKAVCREEALPESLCGVRHRHRSMPQSFSAVRVPPGAIDRAGPLRYDAVMTHHAGLSF